MTRMTSDVESLQNLLQDGFVSLTPIGFDLTQPTAMDHLRGWDLGSD